MELYRKRLWRWFKPNVISPWYAALYATVFSVGGALMVAAGADSGRDGDRRILFISFGLLLLLIGLACWVKTAQFANHPIWKHVRSKGHRGALWKADHRWDTTGQSDMIVFRIVGALVGAAWCGLTVFLILLDAGRRPEPWLDYLMSATIGSIGAGLFIWSGRLLFERLWYGRTRVWFKRCPYYCGELVEVDWECPGIIDSEQVSFTLRFIQQQVYHQGRVVEERWKDHIVMVRPGSLAEGVRVPVTFEVPADAPPTRLSVAEPQYWELEVVLLQRPIRLRRRYLLPIYDRAEAGESAGEGTGEELAGGIQSESGHGGRGRSRKTDERGR